MTDSAPSPSCTRVEHIVYRLAALAWIAGLVAAGIAASVYGDKGWWAFGLVTPIAAVILPCFVIAAGLVLGCAVVVIEWLFRPYKDGRA